MALSQSSIASASKVLTEARRILILPHANIDPDALSSALATYAVLRSLGKEVTVICPETKPDSLSFLPGFEKLEEKLDLTQEFIVTINLQGGVEVDKLRYTVEDQKVNIIVVPKSGKIRSQQISLSEGESPYDLVIVVDTADLPLLGKLYTENIDFFTSLPILNIDHHISNTHFGQVHLIDPAAASATEVLYAFFMALPLFREKITPDIATLILTGLITDTRSFQNPNTTPRSLEIAAALLDLGARQQEIIQHIYKTKPLSTLKIWGRALNRIQMDRDAGIVWSAVSKEDYMELGASSKETHGLLDELLSTIPDSDLYILFTELEEGGMKASLRSSPRIDASRLAAELYGGGGHARAAGFRVKAYGNFQLVVLECVQKLREGMRRQREEGVKGAEGTKGTEAGKESKEAPVSAEATAGKKEAEDAKESKELKTTNYKLKTDQKGSLDIMEGLVGEE